MANCGNKIKNTCGSTTFATCVEYEGDLPEFSELDDCPSIEDTTEELYKFVGEIKAETDLTALGELCLEYTLSEGKIIVKNVLAKFEQIICEQQEKINALENTAICTTSITDCGLDFSGLVDDCGDQPSTLADLLQILINQVTE